jgi:hypothetical protein
MRMTFGWPLAVSYNGDTCAVGFGTEYTFENLRADAAKQWGLDVACVELHDGMSVNGVLSRIMGWQWVDVYVARIICVVFD